MFKKIKKLISKNFRRLDNIIKFRTFFIFGLILATTGISFSYYAMYTGNEGSEDVVIKADSFELSFEDEDEGINISNLALNTKVTKKFKITNTWNKGFTLDIYFKNLINTYGDDNFTYNLLYSETKNGTYKTLAMNNYIPSSYKQTDKTLHTVRLKANSTYYFELAITLVKKSTSSVIDTEFSTNLSIKQNEKIVFVDECQEVGCEVAIGNEHFNIFSNDESEMLILSKYNLNVGNSLVPEAEVGIQSEFARGEYGGDSSCLDHLGTDDDKTVCYDNKYYEMIGGDRHHHGAVSFDSSGSNLHDASHTIHSSYDNSTISRYVNDYAEYLKEMIGNDKIKARLLTIEEIGSTLQNYDGHEAVFYTPKEGYEWILNTTFWSMSVSPNSNYAIMNFSSNGDVGISFYLYAFNYGVRPLITIPISII